MFKEKHINEILSYCFKAAGREGAFHLPKTFAANFKKIKENDVYAVLDYLHENGHIRISRPVIKPEEHEYAVEILTSGKNFLFELEKSKKEFRKNWRWNIWTAIATAIISSLLGAVLARVSQLIW